MKWLFPLQEAKSTVEIENCVFCLVSKAGKALCALSVNTDKLRHRETEEDLQLFHLHWIPSAVIPLRKLRKPKQRKRSAMNN